MHRLRTKKKTKGNDDEDVPPVPALSKGFFTRSKPEPKEAPQVELEFTLPPTDDFRTSLLMPNLANRFSILKQEQAAAAAAAAAKGDSFVAGPDVDGQVLSGSDGYSSSRFMGLGDIAETSSISGSVASAHDKLTSNSEERRVSEEESVMNRSRPQGEGNVLFGGRQKVYKIAPKALRGGTSSMEDLRMGRSVSRDDLPGYHFSRRNTGEKDVEKDVEEEGDNKGDDLPEHDKNRYTSSSTNSTPTTMTRTSTAATSINSQPGHSALVPNPASLPHSPTVAPAKTRRPLYEQALDQQLQDQQSNAMGRLERLASLRRIGSVSPTRSDSPVLGGRGSPQLAFQTSPTTSPTSRPAMPWATANKKGTPPLPPAVEAESPKLEVTKPPRPAGFDKFDFGIDLERTPSPPAALKKSAFPTQGPFSPGALTGDRYQRRSPERERVASLVSDRRSSVSLGAVGSPRVSESHEVRPTAFLTSSATSSERSSMEQDLQIIQHIGDELDDATRDISSSDSSNPPTSVMKPRFPDPEPAAEDEPRPDSPASAVSRVSSLDDEPSRQFLEALRPVRDPEVFPPSPRFTLDAAPSSTNDDTPTIPPGQGLSLLVRQHLRSDSGSSSMYAASTYRLSRVSRHEVAESVTIPTEEPRASVSSAGDNVWQYDEFAHHNHDDEPPSPSSMYPQPVPRQYVSSPPPEVSYRLTGRSNTIRRRESEDDEGRSMMRRKYGRQSDDREIRSPPPPEEDSYRRTGRSNTLRGMQSEDDMRRTEMGRGYGRQSEDDQRRFDLERKYGRQSEDHERRMEMGRGYGRQSEDDQRRSDLERKYGRRVEEPERRDDRRTESSERRGRRRAESRTETERGPSRAGTERSLSRAGDGDNQDRDWAEQLAFRRQLVQQNLRNQEKIQSHHEAEGFRDSPGRNGTLRSKGSNGFLRDAGRPPVIMGPNGPMLADGGRGRGRHDGRVDGERHAVRGPHGFPPGPQYPNGQPRPTQRQRPPLVTNNTFGNGVDPLMPDGRLRKSPSGARLRPGPPHDMMNGGSISAGNTPRGQPMGWQDDWEPVVPNSRSQPATPILRGPPTRPPYQQPGDGYRDDLSRAMITGQSSIAEPPLRQQSPRKRTGSSPENPMENVKSTFEEEDHRPLSFRRPRGNSLIGGRKGPTENPPLPQINTSVLLGPSPNQHMPGTRSAGPGPAPSPARSGTGPVMPSPAASPAMVLQQIESANSVLTAPARKRAVDKYQISQPTLVSKTSKFSTVDLPGYGSEPLTTPPSTASSSKSRKRTNTLFGAFGRGNSDDQVPEMPRGDIDFDDSKSSKSVKRNKLRKSISDGGNLGSRARVNERIAMREQMPRIQRASPAMDKEIGGMI
ncbi:hypothetical protein BDD12DRAFT_16098 [Trichophaea hybrida]|nr:hypothetical protein BDD12DRAFT_16098 [Trichophaea hybrida]